MGFWSRAPPALTQEYQESVAHRVRDILTGENHPSHKNVGAIRDKQALKALQRPEALAGVIEILKSMPGPDQESAEGWEVDEGVDVESEQEGGNDEEVVKGVKERNMKHAAAAAAAGTAAVAATAAVVATKASSSSGSGSNSGAGAEAGSTALSSAAPKGTTIVAATTIAAAAATSAVAATLAVTLRGPRRKVVVNGDGETTTTTTKTVVRFHPSKDTVSSQA